MKKVFWIVLIGALCLTVLGAVRGETQSLLQKATAICLECIGIG